MADFKEALKKNKVAKEPAKKSSVPILSNVPANIITAAKKYQELVDKKKEIEGEMANNHQVVADYCSEIQDQRAFSGSFSKSLKIPVGDANEDKHLMYTTKNVFKIDPESEGDIKKLLGKNFVNLIQENFEVTLKEEVFQNEALQKELMTLLGDNFAKFLNSTSSFKVKENYDEKIYEMAGNKDKLAEIRTFIEPQKPSLK